ncbi:hypothetical protein GE061_006412 [Apolygus lucorum]|uniref:Uncharacterized protein n=1 Tax=Apolygus lucorum TaxID=248454 RepID=A0A8S9WVJ7_APOLU|nr:hypothetical protein GE061_006412 [Apolygus lucorum]
MRSFSCPIVWSRPAMTKPADSIQSSKFTWSEPPIFENDSPLDMYLLMQHFYGRAWRIAKQSHDTEKAFITSLDNAFVERRCISKIKVHRQKMAMSVRQEKPRYIHPKFRNIPSRTDSNWKAQTTESAKEK